MLIGAGCASSDAEPPARRRAAPPNAFLLPPTEGWTGPLDDSAAPGVERRLHGSIARGRHRGGARRRRRAARANPRLPARAGAWPRRPSWSRERSRRGEEAPRELDRRPSDATARHACCGPACSSSAATRQGPTPSTAALAADLPIASERARATREPAVAAAQAALASALAAGRIDQARSWADRIAEWESPDSTAALEARLAVARAAGDEQAELEALRGAARARPLRSRAARAAGRPRARARRRRSSTAPARRAGGRRARRRVATQSARRGAAAVPAAAPARERAEVGGTPRAHARRLRGPALLGGARRAPDPGRQREDRERRHRASLAAGDHPRRQPGPHARRRRDAPLRARSPDHARRGAAQRARGRRRVVPAATALAASRPVRRRARLCCAMPRLRCGILADAAECLPQARLSGGEALGVLGRALSLQKAE